MRFSKRKGLTPAIKELQIDSIDDQLRIRLWNAIRSYYWNRDSYADIDPVVSSKNKHIFDAYWSNFTVKVLDDRPDWVEDMVGTIKQDYFKFEWFEVFDFIEFIFKVEPLGSFVSECNKILEIENSAYRIVGGQVVEITDEVELASIDEAIAASSPFYGVRSHLQSALKYLSDRKNPDYRNSIKESILAVESLCRVITDDSKATLGDALKKIEKNVDLHPALKAGFAKIYGYTSDEGGIRHAMLEESNLSFVDAKYMLVTCTAFINYVIGKCGDQGIEIGVDS